VSRRALERIYLRRRQAYRALFLVENSDRRWWEFWKPKYTDRISKSAVIVLSDLRRFCGVGGSKFQSDARNTDRLLGRDDVWLRVMNNLHVPEEQIYQLVEDLEAYDE
jgi:hypothetical protein